MTIRFLRLGGVGVMLLLLAIGCDQGTSCCEPTDNEPASRTSEYGDGPQHGGEADGEHP